MTTFYEFMPWQSWKSLPENKDLTYDAALRKFNIERDAHLAKLIYYENQQRISNINSGK